MPETAAGDDRKIVYRYAYRRSPDELSEAEVRSYLVKLRDRGAARGTFKVAHYAIQFLYQHTLGCDWPLFSKKRFVCRSTSGCRMRFTSILSYDTEFLGNAINVDSGFATFEGSLSSRKSDGPSQAGN